MALLKDIIKTEDIIKIYPGETLSSAFSKFSTSHDAAFLFSKDNKYLGVISAYYCMIKSSFPGNAKVEHCVFHAPRIHINFQISKVCQLMIESKIHYLPVFDEKDSFIGIISVRRILSKFADSPLFKFSINDFLQIKKKPMVSLYEDDPVAKAMSLFKETKVSKLIVVGKDLKLKGVLSYYDLISYLVSPREEEKISFMHMKVKNFSKTLVLTLTNQNTLHEALNLILEKRIGSIVIIDKDRHPEGIITTSDFLTFLIRKKVDLPIEITSKNLSEQSRQIIGGFFNYLNLWLKRIPDLQKVKLHVKEEKQGKLFEVILSLTPKKGNPKVIKKEGKNLLKVLKEIPHK
jgi:CBS domain-containing protein